MNVSSQPSAEADLDDGDSLFARYQICQALFRKLVLSVTGNSCAAVDSGDIDVQKVLDEYGRFKIWGAESRVILPPSTHGSLDHTLRHSKDIRGNVGDIFVQVGKLLTYGKFQLGL